MTNQHKHTLAFIAFITVLVSGQYFITDAFNTAMQLAGYYAVGSYIGKACKGDLATRRN